MTLSSTRVLWPDGGVRPGTIRIAHGVITAVEPGCAADAEHLGDRVICPAFVDGHTHLSLTCLRGVGGLASLEGNVVEELYFAVEDRVTADDVLAFTRLGALDAVLSGVGAVFDHYYFATAVAQGMADVGLSGVVAPALQDINGPGVARQDDTWRALEDLARWSDDGIVPALGPHATDTVSDALFERIARAAQDLDLPVHMHLSQSPDELARSVELHGAPPLTRLLDRGWLDAGPAWLLVHSLYVSPHELDRLDPDRHLLGHCPTSQAQFDFPCSIQPWVDRGLPVVLGTDAACCNDTHDVQGELRWLDLGPSWALGSVDDPTDPTDPTAIPGFRARRQARHGRRFAPRALLDTVWSNPGGFHPEFQVGRIQAGHRANLLVLDPDHPALWPCTDVLHALAYNRVAPAIWGMVVNGRWVGERGDFHRSLLRQDHVRDWVREGRARLTQLMDG